MDGRMSRYGNNFIEALREFCEREGKEVTYRKGVTFSSITE